MKKVVILQSNYIPWKGYFDLIRDADLFVFYDDRQFTNRDWRTRNKIKTSQGSQWLTVPVGTDTNRLICEVEIKDHHWQRKHWETIKQQYGKCSYFADYRLFFENFYLANSWTNLSEMNQQLIQKISKELLGISTQFTDSREYAATGEKLDRLLNVIHKTQATHYISGPAARDYIDAKSFAEMDIELIWKNYSGYPEYPQRFPPFEHGVSILDVLFNVGPDAPEYIWGWREKEILK